MSVLPSSVVSDRAAVAVVVAVVAVVVAAVNGVCN